MKPTFFSNSNITISLFEIRTKFFCLISLMIISFIFENKISAQAEYNIDDVNGLTLYTDGGTILLYDSGGPENPYSGGEDYSVTICSGSIFAGCPQPPLHVFYNYIDIEPAGNCAFDRLVVDGAVYCNSNYPPLYGTTGFSYYTNDNGCIEIQFTSDLFDNFDGFALDFMEEQVAIVNDDYLTCGAEVSDIINIGFEGSSPAWLEFYDCQGSTFGPYFGEEQLYYLDVEGIVTITINEEVDAFFYTTGIGIPGCPPQISIGCLTGNQTSLTLDADDYPFGISVIIDHEYTSPYTLSIICNDECDPPPVDCGIIYTDFLSNGSSEHSIYDCAPGSDYDLNEFVYVFTPESSGEYTINTTTPSGLAPAIIVNDCCFNEPPIGGPIDPWIIILDCTYCEHSGNSGSTVNQLTVQLEEGLPYYIYVEQITSFTDQFTLWIDCFGCTELYEIECGIGVDDTNDPTQFDPNIFTTPTDRFNTHSECANKWDGCVPQGFSTTFDVPEVSYVFNNNEPPTIDYDNNICIDLFPREEGLDVDLFVYDDCDNGDPSFCVATSTREPGLVDGIFLEAPPRFEDYFVIVDGQTNSTQNNTGKYEIAVTCGNLCNKIAQPLFCGVPTTGELEGTDENVSSHYCCAQTENYPDNNAGHTGEDYSGGGNTGPEDLYYFDIESNNTTVVIDLEILDGQSDLELFLLRTCDVTTCLDRSVDSPGNAEKITYTLQAGRYYVVVEGHDWNEGAYRITISGCEDCALFVPHQSENSNEVFFTNTTGFVCKYFIVKTPYDSVANGELTLYDSIAVSSNEDLVYYFPFPGCYELCFYYCDPQGVIYECCFKYCPDIKRYDCEDAPDVHVVSETATHSTISVLCGGGGGIPISPPGRGEDCDSCYISVTNLGSGIRAEYDINELITLPFGEYEVCCWRYDPVCEYWNICCEIICIPYINPNEEDCLFGGITVVQQGQQYMYTYGGPAQGLTWNVTPNVGQQIVGDKLIVDNPPPGRYKVCAIYDSSSGGVIIKDTCCVYLCVDEPPVDNEECFDIIQVDNEHVRLQCNTGRPVYRWEVIEWIDPVPVYVGIFYGPNPIVKLEAGKQYRIIKYYAGCCREEASCERDFCFGCGSPDDHCDFYTPVYYDDFDLGNGIGYPYEFGDSVSVNSFWWSGQGGYLFGNDVWITENGVAFLDLKNSQTNSTQILNVSFDVSVKWIRDLSTGLYTPEILGDFCLAGANRQCVSASLQQLMSAVPGVRFDYCGGGADIDFCYSNVEILIDRSGPVRIYIDGRPVLEDLTPGGLVEYLRFDGILTIDNVTIEECNRCAAPMLNPNTYVYCPDIIFTGINHGSGIYTADFTHNGNGTAWSLFNAMGSLIQQDPGVDDEWTSPPLQPGNTYFVCRTYIDTNGCEALCCIKFSAPVSCNYFTPYFNGDENTLNYLFEADEETSGYEVEGWYVNGERLDDDQDVIEYVFPAPGRYHVCCLFWDPFTQCFIWCCREICAENPLDCDQVIIDYDGAEDEYVLRINGAVTILSWNIDQPTGLPNDGYIGNANPQRFRPADFGITPGQEIIVSARYVDADGCIKICCKRLCLPVTTPQEECNNIFPYYLGAGLQYRYYVDPSAGIDDIQWRLHIPGTNQVLDIGQGVTSDDLDFVALQQLYPSLVLDQVCISILYRDVADGCYKICCKCFCIEVAPLDCDDIIFYFNGSTSSPLAYHFGLEAVNATQIQWKIDETNTPLSNQAPFDVDFAEYGYAFGQNLTVTVTYYDETSDCFRVCCKRICLVDPFQNDCAAISNSGLNGNVISVSTNAASPLWTIPGIDGIYNEISAYNIDITDPQLAPVVTGASELTICVTYMDNGCCITCCESICLIQSGVSCDNFDVTYTDSGNDFSFQFTDTNPLTGLSTHITLPDGQEVLLTGNAGSYVSSDEGTYTICRIYTDACNGELACCQEICVSHGLVCNPVVYTVNPNDERDFTFTHNIIGGVSYLWDFGDGSTSTSDLTSVDHQYTPGNGTYTVCLTVTDECGVECHQCITVSVGEINFNPVIVNPSCQAFSDGSIDLNIAGGTPPVEIIWSTGTTGSDILTTLTAGHYSVTVTDGVGLDTVFEFDLIAPELPLLQTEVVNTSCGEINGEITVSSTNATSIASFDWIPSTITDVDGHLEGLEAGLYGVIITDEFGCISEIDSIIVEPSSEIQPIDFGGDIVACPDDSIVLSTGTISAGNININWYKDGQPIQVNTTTLQVTESGLYSVEVSNAENCIREAQVMVTFHDQLLGFPADMPDLMPGTEVNLAVQQAESVIWSTDVFSLSCASCLSTTLTVSENGFVIADATDVNGCTEVDTIHLQIDLSPVEGPNYITPNGDGMNDVLVFNGLELFEFKELIIFNRWGQVLEHIELYDNQWNATINDTELPDGVYYYVLDYGNLFPGQFQFKSDLTIIRSR